jgi:hypothetical protein
VIGQERQVVAAENPLERHHVARGRTQAHAQQRVARGASGTSCRGRRA